MFPVTFKDFFFFFFYSFYGFFRSPFLNIWTLVYSGIFVVLELCGFISSLSCYNGWIYLIRLMRLLLRQMKRKLYGALSCRLKTKSIPVFLSLSEINYHFLEIEFHFFFFFFHACLLLILWMISIYDSNLFN